MDIIVIFIVLFIIEGYTFANVELSQDPTKTKENRNWHKSKFIKWLLIATTTCYYMYGTTLEGGLNLLFLGFLGQFVFNTSINLIKGNRVYHLGNEGIDKYLKPIESFYWALSLIILTFVTITYYVGH